MSAGDTIQPSQHNPAMSDIATALSSSLSRDGLGGMRAPLDAGGYKIVNIANGTNAQDAATYAQVQGLGVPVGFVGDFAGSIAPAGWLLCFGQAVSRTSYAQLFAVLGTTYGAGDGSTTFNLPDFRGRVAAGRDDMGESNAGRLSNYSSTILGAGFGSQEHVLTTAQIPSHDHGGATTVAGAHTHQAPFLGSPTGGEIGAPANTGTLGAGVATSSAGDHSHGISAQGGGAAHPNVQPTLILNKIIRAGVS